MNPEVQRLLAAYNEIEEQEESGRPFFGFEGPAAVYRIYERYYYSLLLLKHYGYHPLLRLKILDIGCANGIMLREFVQWGAQPENLYGIEVREKPVERANQLGPDMHVQHGLATDLPWEPGYFDLVCLHTVFTSILDQETKLTIAVKVDRVLRDGGAVFWYDFIYNNPKNPNVRGIKSGEIRRLFPNYDLHLRKITLAPPIARHIPVSFLPVLYPLLSSISFLQTHYLGLLKKPAQPVAL